MVGNYQRPHRSEPCPAVYYHDSTSPASQLAATSHDLVKANTIEEIVAPVFRFPFSGTYSSQLEIPEDEDPPVYYSTAIFAPAIMETHQRPTTAVSTPWTTTQETTLTSRISHHTFPSRGPGISRAPPNRELSQQTAARPKPNLLSGKAKHLLRSHSTTLGKLRKSLHIASRTSFPNMLATFDGGAERSAVAFESVMKFSQG